ncbi:cupin domain-containing protein [Microbacterium sp. HD4P20]|uniref:cupin domain-containing protein n=1 Tax=Microbacterium sp. HD4P20 TaxID=2864874 RepID=UPI0020A521E1|nr:cupin domain-containing protein [Microbacterium sp. HD4P20]MCP2636061.1 cupin domain-containing protein [Microbacterium sp. HD4P20]
MTPSLRRGMERKASDMSDGLFDAPKVPRRIVTTTRDGRSVVASDGPAPNAVHHAATPGMLSSVLYRTAGKPMISDGSDESAPVGAPLLPRVGETTLLIVQFPPDSIFGEPDFDGASAAAEHVAFAADFAARFEPDAPGVHTTDSIDYDIVLDGEIWLELDDETVHLRAGDVAIQNGTRHAWRNKGDRPATMAFVLVGAERS